jgi:hypothetical protein
MRHHPVQDVLLSRWRYDDIPRLQPIKTAMLRVLDVEKDVRERHGGIAKDANLSALGRQDALRKFIADKTAAEMHRARRTVESMRANLDKWRARLTPQYDTASR